MYVKRVEMVVRKQRNALPLLLQSCDSWMFVKENPDRKKKKKNTHTHTHTFNNVTNCFALIQVFVLLSIYNNHLCSRNLFWDTLSLFAVVLLLKKLLVLLAVIFQMFLFSKCLTRIYPNVNKPYCIMCGFSVNSCLSFAIFSNNWII